MDRFLLIGSDGYLGSSFKKYLKKQNKIIYEYKYNDFYSNKSFNNFKGKIRNIIHFAISTSLNKEKNFNHDINFARNLFKFSKKNKINCFYISSISAFKGNYSAYSILKQKIEKDARKHNINIIRPGMIWANKPRSWFGSIDKIVQMCFLIIPLIGKGNHHIYLVHLNDFLKTIFNICKKPTNKKIVIFNKKTHTLREIIEKICIKRKKKTIFIAVPSQIIYPIFKILYLLKILPFSIYDSILSYKYAKKHEFRNFLKINTSKSFSNY